MLFWKHLFGDEISAPRTIKPGRGGGRGNEMLRTRDAIFRKSERVSRKHERLAQKKL
jgi:hypothetical protein